MTVSTMPTHSSGISQGCRIPLRPMRPCVVAPLTRFGPPGPPAPEEGGMPGEGASGDGGGPGGGWVIAVGLLLHIGPRGDRTTISLSPRRCAPARRNVDGPRPSSALGDRREWADGPTPPGAGHRGWAVGGRPKGAGRGPTG